MESIRGALSRRASAGRCRWIPTPRAGGARTTAASSSSSTSSLSMTGANNMNAFKRGGLVLLLALLSACGRQLVEFPKADAGVAPDASGATLDAAGNDL